MLVSVRIAALVVCASLWLVGPAAGRERSAGGVLYDVAVERPIGVAETALGLGVAIVAYPMALGSGRSGDVLDRCIAEPARHTFVRALGDFRRPARSRCSAIGLGWSLSRMALGALRRPLDLLFGPSPLTPERHSSDELEARASDAFRLESPELGV